MTNVHPGPAVAAPSHLKGEELARAAARVIPGGVNSATRSVGAPYGFSRADGAHITDVDGNTYLDYHAAFGAVAQCQRQRVDQNGLAGAGLAGQNSQPRCKIELD